MSIRVSTIRDKEYLIYLYAISVNELFLARQSLHQKPLPPRSEHFKDYLSARVAFNACELAVFAR